MRQTDIHLNGMILNNVTLNSMKEQLPEPELTEVVNLLVDSQGGHIEEGLNIMLWIEELKSKGIRVNAYLKNVYSMATIIGQNADRRYISSNGSFMIHDPIIPRLKCANPKSLKQHFNQLQSFKSDLINIYLQNNNKLSFSQLDKLMYRETTLNANTALKGGFVDSIVADFEVNKMQPERVYEDGENGLMNIFTKQSSVMDYKKHLLRLLGMHKGKEVLNAEYNTLGGDMIEIFHPDGEPYSVGDTTSVESGSFDLPDGYTVVVEDGVITEIMATDIEQKGAMNQQPSNDGGNDERFSAINQRMDEMQTVLNRFNEFESAVSNVSTLKEENESLKESNKRLEQLLVKVQDDLANVKKNVGSNFTPRSNGGDNSSQPKTPIQYAMSKYGRK